jgi:hypothetical protein
MPVYRDRWAGYLFSTAPADRAEAEAGVHETYRTAGLAEPRHFLWFESPLRGAVAAGLLRGVGAGTDHASAQEDLALRLGVAGWAQAVQMAGALHSRPAPPHGNPPLIDGIFNAAYAHDLVLVLELNELLQQVETAATTCFHCIPSILEAEVARAAGARFADLLSGSMTAAFLFGLLAEADFRAEVLGDPNAAGYRGLIRVAHHSTLWWAFDNVAVMVDHPAELHRDAEGKLHHDRGPALACRDGWEIYAWHRTVVGREWILQPQSITIETIRAERPPYQEILIDIYGKDRYRRDVRAAKKSAPPVSKLLGAVLPRKPEERLRLLREHTPNLPLYDRYVAGEHEKVWAELTGLGDQIRRDPYAADALAVAYETMTRARRNVEILVERLRRLRYAFSGRPHEPPGRKVSNQIAQMEKLAGPLPLSLRAWYNVVGSVDFTGAQAALSARDGGLSPDPLVVHPLEEMLDDCKAWKEEAEAGEF